MSELGFDLHALFPAQVEVLRILKRESEHYRTLASRHHDLTREIGSIERGAQPCSNGYLDALKTQRLLLLDEIAEMVAERQAV